MRKLNLESDTLSKINHEYNPLICYVITVDESVVGLLTFQLGTPLNLYLSREDTIYLDLLCIHPKYRRQGFGTALMVHLEKECRKHNREYISAPAPPADHGFYEKLGFNKSNDIWDEHYKQLDVRLQSSCRIQAGLFSKKQNSDIPPIDTTACPPRPLMVVTA